MESYDEIQRLSDYFSYLSSPRKMKQRVEEELNMCLIWSSSSISSKSSFAVKRDLTANFVWVDTPGGGGYSYIFRYGDVPLNRVSFSGF